MIWKINFIALVYLIFLVGFANAHMCPDPDYVLNEALRSGEDIGTLKIMGSRVLAALRVETTIGREFYYDSEPQTENKPKGQFRQLWEKPLFEDYVDNAAEVENQGVLPSFHDVTISKEMFDTRAFLTSDNSKRIECKYKFTKTERWDRGTGKTDTKALHAWISTHYDPDLYYIQA